MICDNSINELCLTQVKNAYFFYLEATPVSYLQIPVEGSCRSRAAAGPAAASSARSRRTGLRGHSRETTWHTAVQ